MTYFQIDIEGTGRNTHSLIDEASRLKAIYEQANTPPIDRLWVVFDRDSFTANDFNTAILRCQNAKPAIGCAWSNEAFELWYLLHFQYYENGMSRMEYKNLIEASLKPFAGINFRYKKNNEEMYVLLKQHGSLDNAIRNAKRLSVNFGDRQDYANHNPCTMVWKLVKELNQLNK